MQRSAVPSTPSADHLSCGRHFAAAEFSARPEATSVVGLSCVNEVLKRVFEPSCALPMSLVVLLAACCLLASGDAHDHDHAVLKDGHHDHAPHDHGPHDHGHHGHNCIHEGELPNFAREDGRRLQDTAAAPGGASAAAPALLSAYEPIQFFIDYQGLDTDITASTVKTGLDAAQVKNFLQTKLMPDAMKFFSAALKVKPASPRVIKLPQECSTVWSGSTNVGKCGSFRPSLTCGAGIIKPEFYGERRESSHAKLVD